MKFETINREYTEKVTEYLAKGYTINTATMNGSQGEIGKIDLTDGKEIIRILLDSFCRPCERIGDRYYNMEGIELIVGRVTDDVTPHSASTWGTVWNQNLEVLSSKRFYEIGRASRNDKKWYGTWEEAIAQQEKASARYYERYVPERQELSDQAKEVVLPYVRRQPKCKTVKSTEIESITKHHVKSRSGKQFVKYTIKVRGQVFDLR